MANRSTRDTPAKVPAAAPGQALGIGLQYTLLALRLLRARDGTSCSMEVLEDIEEQRHGGERSLIQSKSALTANPVTNRSLSLWKSLWNWCALIRSELIDPESTEFILYVSRLVTGEIVSAFHNASNEIDAQTALRDAQEKLVGPPPGFAKRNQLPRELLKYVAPVLIDNASATVKIIQRFRLECGSGSAQTDLLDLLRQHPVHPDNIADIADKLSGWVKRRVDAAMERGEPAVIPRDEFHLEYVSYVRRIDRDLILKSLARRPSSQETQDRLLDTFVRQLQLIDLPYDDQLHAISDFLMAIGNRVEWARMGQVHEDSFTELEERLARIWANLQRIVVAEASAATEEMRGQILHARCMIHEARLQGMETPSHFVPGCFHGLADELTIGWHPSYKSLLASEKE